MKNLRQLPLLLALLIPLLGLGCSAKYRHGKLLAAAQKHIAAGNLPAAEIELLNALRIDPLSPQAIADLGVLYFDQGRYGKAIPSLLHAVRLQPDNLTVRNRLARVYLTARKSHEASLEIEHILAKNPADEEAPLLLAQNAGDKPADLDALRQRLEKLLETTPANPALHLALGHIDLRRNQPEKAAEKFARSLALNPGSPAVHYALATLHLSRGETSLAEKAFARTAELSPDRSGRRLALVHFKAQQGDLPSAIALLQPIVKKTPDFIPAGTLLTELLLTTKKPDDAAALLQRLLGLDPANLDLLLLGARLHAAQNQNDKALAVLEQARDLYPQSAQVQHQCGLLYLANGKTREAAAAFTLAQNLDPNLTDAPLLLAGIAMLRSDHAGAIVILKQVVQKSPNNERAYAMLAAAYQSHGETEIALRLYQKLEEHSPNRPEYPVARGILLARTQRPDQARAAFERALTLAPDSLPAHEQLLNLDLAEKQHDAAETRLLRLVQRKPSAPEPHLFLARIQLARSDPSAAIASLEKAIALQPDYRPAYLLAALVHRDTRETPKAIERLRSLVEKNPRDVAALMLLGTLCEQEARPADARDAYEKLLAANPAFTPALNNLACLYADRLANLPRALELARKARELAPADPRIADTLGWALYKNGEYTRALPLLQESAAKLPSDTEVLHHLGLACYATADEPAAIAAFRAALAANEHYPDADEARRHLAILLLPLDPAQLPVLQTHLAAHPGDPVALNRQASIHALAGNRDRALALYNQLLEKHPQHIPALCGLATLLAAAPNTLPKALEHAKTAYKIAPDDPAAAHTLGRIAYATGDHQWAASLLQLAARKRDNDPALLLDYADAEYAAGDTADAAQTLRTLLRLTPLDPALAARARQTLELAALADNPTEPDATSKISAALVDAPASLPALAASAALAEHHGKTPAAIAAWEDILRRYPSFSPATRRLGLLLAATAAHDKTAAELLFKAREKKTADPELARALGLVLHRTGDHARAATFLQECAARYPNDPDLLYALGLSQLRVKDTPAARAHLTRALELNPAHPRAPDARRALGQLK